MENISYIENDNSLIALINIQGIKNKEQKQIDELLKHSEYYQNLLITFNY